MNLKTVQLCALTVLWLRLFLSRAGNIVTVCPDSDDYHDNDCFKLHLLLSNPNLIKSNTTFKFIPATFKLKSALVFENITSITLNSVAPARANISCVRDNSGILFQNVSGSIIQNINIVNCTLQNQASVILRRSADILLANITIKYGKGGVFAADIYGNLSISSTLFMYMQGIGFSLQYNEFSFDQYPSLNRQPYIVISNTDFKGFLCRNLYTACIIDVGLDQLHFPLILHVVDVILMNNTHGNDVSEVLIQSQSILPTHIILERFIRENNFVHVDPELSSFGGSFFYRYDGVIDHNDSNINIIEIINSSFVNNVYEMNGGDLFNMDENIYCTLNFFTDSYKPHRVSISSTDISNNTGSYGAAICSDFTTKIITQPIFFYIIGSTFASNTVFSSNYYRKGTVVLKNIYSIEVLGCSFLNNTGTGLLVESSLITFCGFNVFRGNQAYNGGGLGIYRYSSIKFEDHARLTFENNSAENFGGGMYVEKNEVAAPDVLDNPCFIQSFTSTVLLLFNDNSAKVAGNDVYGGDIDRCSIDRKYYGWKVMKELIHSVGNYSIDLTSDPSHICDCSVESTQDCLIIAQTINTISTYPGKEFNLSLIAVGQLIQNTVLSGVPSAIYASLLPQNSTELKSGIIPDAMLVQNGLRICSNLLTL